MVKFKNAAHKGFCCSRVYNPKVLESSKTVGGEAGSTCHHKSVHTLGSCMSVRNHHANCVCVSGIESALATTKRRSQGSKSLHPLPHFLAPLSANLLEALQALHCSTSHSLSKFPESKVHSHPSPDTLVQGTSHLHLPTSRDGSRPSCSTSLQHLKADHLPSCMEHSLLLTSERPHGWFSSCWPPTFSFPLPPPGETHFSFYLHVLPRRHHLVILL